MHTQVLQQLYKHSYSHCGEFHSAVLHRVSVRQARRVWEGAGGAGNPAAHQ